MNTKYTKELLEDAVNNSSSMSQVLGILNLHVTGGNHRYIKSLILAYGIDVSKLNGRAWNIGRTYSNKASSDYLKVYPASVSISTDRIKKRLLKDGTKEHKCEICGVESWLGKPIALQMHHIDGDRWNNVLDNLQLLCPNCHSATENFAGKKRRGTLLKKRNTCVLCGGELSCNTTKNSLCVACYNKKRAVEKPDITTLIKDVESLGKSGAGRKYGVSPTTIRKWMCLKK